MICKNNFSLDNDRLYYRGPKDWFAWTIVNLDKCGFIKNFAACIEPEGWPEEFCTPDVNCLEEHEIIYDGIKPGLPGRWWTQFEGNHYSELIQFLCSGRCEL